MGQLCLRCQNLVVLTPAEAPARNTANICANSERQDFLDWSGRRQIFRIFLLCYRLEHERGDEGLSVLLRFAHSTAML